MENMKISTSFLRVCKLYISDIWASIASASRWGCDRMRGGVLCPWEKGDNWGDVIDDTEETGEARCDEGWETGDTSGVVRGIHFSGVLLPTGETSGDVIGVASRAATWSILELDSSILSSACCVSRWRRRSTFRWNARPHFWQPKGRNPVCFLQWVMRFEDWLKAFPQWVHL